MHKVVATIDGRDITAAEQIVASIRAGNYVETAAAAAGIAKETLYEWLRVGANARHKPAHGKGSRTAHERRCIEFSDAVAAAVAASESEAVARLEQIARGGLAVKVETVKVDATGNVIERTTRTEQTLPDARVLEWRLERRFSKRWGQKGSLEVTGADGGPIIVDTLDARTMIERALDRIEARMASPQPAAIDVSVTDTVVGDGEAEGAADEGGSALHR